jgi:hypothetical protein
VFLKKKILILLFKGFFHFSFVFLFFFLILKLGSDFLDRKLIQNCQSTFKADSYKNENQNSFNFETGKNNKIKQNSTLKNKN